MFKIGDIVRIVGVPGSDEAIRAKRDGTLCKIVGKDDHIFALHIGPETVNRWYDAKDLALVRKTFVVIQQKREE